MAPGPSAGAFSILHSLFTCLPQGASPGADSPEGSPPSRQRREAATLTQNSKLKTQNCPFPPSPFRLPPKKKGPLSGPPWVLPSGPSRADGEGSHHLVVLVFEDVAVPDVEAGQVEVGPDARDLAGIGDDGVLGAGFPGLGWANRSADHLPIHHFEFHQVQMDGMGIGR